MDVNEPPVFTLEPGGSRVHETSGSWMTEAASAAELDARLARMGLFRVYSEVRGELLQPRHGQHEKTVRIDRILVPRASLLALGWRLGAIGIEVKRSGIHLGPPLAQAMDYTRAAWSLRGVHIMLGAVFLWPMDKVHGPVASLMVHNRVGSASVDGQSIHLRLGEENVLRLQWGTDEPDVGTIDSGHKVGSR